MNLSIGDEVTLDTRFGYRKAKLVNILEKEVSVYDKFMQNKKIVRKKLFIFKVDFLEKENHISLLEDELAERVM